MIKVEQPEVTEISPSSQSSEAYSQPSKTPKTELFVKIVNGFNL